MNLILSKGLANHDGCIALKTRKSVPRSDRWMTSQGILIHIAKTSQPGHSSLPMQRYWSLSDSSNMSGEETSSRFSYRQLTSQRVRIV